MAIFFECDYHRCESPQEQVFSSFGNLPEGWLHLMDAEGAEHDFCSSSCLMFYAAKANSLEGRSEGA